MDDTSQSERKPLARPNPAHGGALSGPWVLLAAGAIVVAFLVWQAQLSTESISVGSGSRQAGSVDGGVLSSEVSVDTPLESRSERPVVRLSSLSELNSATKGSVVQATGIIADVVDRPGVPYRVTIADSTGAAAVVVFRASPQLKDRVRPLEWMRLTATVDTYRGAPQLEPVALSLVEIGLPMELGVPEGAAPVEATTWTDLEPGRVVRVDATILSAVPTRSGTALHGTLQLFKGVELGDDQGDEVMFLWSDPPPELGTATRVRALALVGEYEGKKQLRPYSASAACDRAESLEQTIPLADALARAPGSVVQTRGIVLDLVESTKVPLSATIADGECSCKVLLGTFEEAARERLRQAIGRGETIAVRARTGTYRNEVQLQALGESSIEYDAAEPAAPPPPLEWPRRGDPKVQLGGVFSVAGVLEPDRENRVGGLSGTLELEAPAPGGGRRFAFIWWNPPDWAKSLIAQRRGVKVRGCVRIGEFRGLQLEVLGCTKEDE